LLAAGFLLVAGFLVARFTLRPEHSVIFTSAPARLGGSLGNSLLIQLRIWAMEFTQVILPHDLCADYGAYSIRDFSVPVSAVIVALLVAAQVFLGFRDRLFLFGSAFFWAGLLPVSNIVPLFRPVADRFLYLPLAGAAMLLAQALYLARGLRPMARTALYAAVILWTGINAAIAFRREAVWHDSLALWEDTVSRNPFSLTAANNLGWALLAAGRIEPAGASFQRAIQLSGGAEPDPWSGLALAFEAQGQPAAADGAFRRAVALDARYAHPAELVRALLAEPEVAGKLELLARRNTKP
jgi:tetratricopeptide (TPR) repeat protein